MLAALVAANLIIVAGYFYLAIRVGPELPVPLWAKYAATAFFCFCAGTHLDQIVHLLTITPHAEWHMQAIHWPQAVAVWVFAIGFRRSLKRLNDHLNGVKPWSVGRS